MQLYNFSEMKQPLFIVIFFLSLPGSAQELYSATEPASNMAVGSIGFRVDNLIMNEINSTKTNYHFIPGIQIGVSKKLMLQGNVFFSNRNEKFAVEGGSLYAKYRFLSNELYKSISVWLLLEE